MKKTYIAPTMDVIKVQVANVMATSMPIVNEGSVAASYVDVDAYVLGVIDNEVGFYTANKNFNDANEKVEADGVKWLNNGFKAYLPVSASGARFISFDFGTETSIDELKGENGNVKTVIYDLSGRRVQGAQKGIFIVNGKKVIK